MELLISRLSKGEYSAFSELYDQYWESLYGFVNSRIHNSEASEDILHDLFLSLWKNREKLVEIHSLESYMYTSCRYLIIAFIKKQARIIQSVDSALLEIEDSQSSLEDRLHYRHVLDQLHSEVERLPEKCRQVFRLSREQHLTNLEISQELGVTESTVENHINKALRRLRVVAKHFMTFLMFF